MTHIAQFWQSCDINVTNFEHESQISEFQLLKVFRIFEQTCFHGQQLACYICYKYQMLSVLNGWNS